MRLIDADNVVFEFKRMLDNVDERNAKPDQKEEFKIIRTYIEWARYVVECAPIVDAVEVVRSKWVEAEDIGDCCYACLNCGFIRDGYLSYPANYCPNCGAKMEEEQ